MDDDRAYQNWCAAQEPEPPQWKCEYCGKWFYGRAPFKHAGVMDACSRGCLASLEYLDECADGNAKNDRDIAVAIGFLALLGYCFQWGAR